MGTTNNETVTAVEPESFGRAYQLEWKQGSKATLLGLERHRARSSPKSFAKKRHLKVGQPLHAAHADRAGA